MTDSLYAWSQTAADNGNSDATINWLEGQDPDTVNDSARAMMRRVAQFLADLAPTRFSTGFGNAYAVTSQAAGANFRNGEIVSFIASFTNTGTATLNVNARGAKPLRAFTGVALKSGEIRNGQLVTAFFYAGADEWLVINSGANVNAMTEGLLTQSIVGRLPRVGDPVLSFAPTPRQGHIRLTETVQAVLKSAWPELDSWASGLSYPWGSTATHFNLPPAAGYFLRFAASNATIDGQGPRTAGSVQADAIKSHVHNLAAHTHSLAAHTHGFGDLTAATTLAGAHVHAITATADNGGVDHTHVVAGTSATESASHTHAVGSLAVASGGVDHTHHISTSTASVNLAHSHSVTGTAASAGAHTHDIANVFVNSPASIVSSGGGAIGSFQTTTTTSAGAHTHSVTGTTDSQLGSHSHAIEADTGTATAFLHTHGLTGATATASSTHTHDFSVTSGAASSFLHTHTIAASAGTAGDHTHAIQMAGSTAGPSNNTSGTPSVSDTAATGVEETRAKNVAIHLDIIGSTALVVGTLGAFGHAYAFGAGTATADPGAGYLSANSATLAAITQLCISETDQWGASIAGVLGALTANTVLKLSSVGAPANFLVVRVTASPTDVGPYRTVPVAFIDGGGSFAQDARLALEWAMVGATGAVGPAGATGSDVGIRWNFESSTTMAAPATGGLRLNNAVVANVTQLALAAACGETGNPNVLGVVQSWDDSTNTAHRGTLTVRKAGSPNVFFVYSIVGALVDNTSWLQVPVQFTGGSGALSAGDAITVAFTRTGNVGAPGPGSGDMLGANNLSDVSSVPSARNNLGLGSMATQPASGVAITGGTLDGITSLNQGPLTGLGNRVINGCMRINQRALASNADDTYAFDRWNILTQSGAVAASQVTNIENGWPYAMRITQSQASAQRFGTNQIVETRNSIDLRGKTVMAAASVRCSVATNVRITILEWTGTADAVISDSVADWTSATYTPGNFFLGTTTTLVATATVALSANTVATISASGALSSSLNNLIVLITTDSTQAQNVTLDVGKVRLTTGAAIVPFEYRPMSLELDLCRRYCLVDATQHLVDGYDAVGGAATYAYFVYAPPMRVTPTVTYSLDSSSNCNTSGSNTAAVPKSAATWFLRTTGAAVGRMFAFFSTMKHDAEL